MAKERLTEADHALVSDFVHYDHGYCVELCAILTDGRELLVEVCGSEDEAREIAESFVAGAIDEVEGES